MRIVREENDLVYMEYALNLSTYSTCISNKIGAVLVSDGHILGAGYNNSVTCDCCSTVNKSMLTKEGKLDKIKRPIHSAWSDSNEIHAEMAAILNAINTGNRVQSATLYTTQSPCIQCVKNIAFLGMGGSIKRVVFLDKYDRGSDSWKKILNDVGIIVDKVDREQLVNVNFDEYVLNNNE